MTRRSIASTFAAWLRPEAALLAGTSLAMLVLAVATAAQALLIGPLLRALTGGAPDGLAALQGIAPGLSEALGAIDARLLFPALLVATALVKGCAYFLQFFGIGWVAQRVVRRLRLQLGAQLFALTAEELAERTPGDLLSRFGADLQGVELALTYGLASWLRDGLQILVLVGVAFWLEPTLAAVAFGIVPLAALPLAALARRLRRSARRAQDRLGGLADRVQEVAVGHRVAQVYGLQAALAEGFAQENAAQLHAGLRSLRQRAIGGPVMELAAVSGVALALVVAVRLAGGDAVLPAGIVSFVATVALVFQPAKTIGKVGGFWLQGLAGAERIEELLLARSSVQDAPGARGAAELSASFSLEAVVVERGGRRLLDGLSLELPAGALVALVGPSGAGKSTLTRLLSRHLDPDQGEVRFGGVPLRGLRRAALRAEIAVVPQEAVLFAGTVAQNVLLGLPRDEARLQRALREAAADEVVAALPGGLEHELVERGIALSGGQRQRLALARALYRGARVLVLDEATSALDEPSEQRILAAVEALRGTRTIVVVAHRLATIRRADRIVVMEGGRVVEQGTHEALAARSGLYARLLAGAGP